MDCSQCARYDRRAFLEQLAALLGVSALAACSADIVTLPMITAFTINVATYPALATVGGVALVSDGSGSGHPIVVSRIDASSFIALSLICPHQGATVQLTNGTFTCPSHGARFSSNGTWTGGQSTSSLSRYAVVYNPIMGTLTIG